MLACIYKKRAEMNDKGQSELKNTGDLTDWRGKFTWEV